MTITGYHLGRRNAERVLISMLAALAVGCLAQMGQVSGTAGSTQVHRPLPTPTPPGPSNRDSATHVERPLPTPTPQPAPSAPSTG
jgi:hypothetical protein